MAEPGLLEFDRVPNHNLSSSHRRSERITVMVSSVACEGMRISRPEPIDELRPGARVNMRMFVHDREVVLPGQVAWLVSSGGGETHVGIELWLEAAASWSRMLWRGWISEQLAEQAERAAS